MYTTNHPNIHVRADRAYVKIVGKKIIKFPCINNFQNLITFITFI